MPEVMTKPKCKTVNCQRELTYLEEPNCWRCLVCNPLTPVAPTEKPESKYIDVKMTEEKVREIVRDELENWYIPKPPATKAETGEMTTTEAMAVEENLPTSPDWRQQARELGINSFGKKKVDVLAEIEAKKNQN